MLPFPYLVFVKKADPQVQAFLAARRRGWSLQWSNDPVWNLLAVSFRVWEMAKADDGTRAVVVPALWRTMRKVPQKYKNYLTARAIAWQDSDSILDVLIELTGIEDLGE